MPEIKWNSENLNGENTTPDGSDRGPIEQAALGFYGNQSSNHGSHFCTNYNYKQELSLIL